MPSPPDVGVVVVAAGAGQRAGGGVAKQFREIAGIPMLLRTLRPFLSHPAVGLVAAVVPEETVTTPPAWLAPLVGERLRLVAGGPERVDSVERGLAALGDGYPIVLVHDGARPFVDRQVIDAVVEPARRGFGGVAAVPVSDTLKEAATDPELDRPTIAATVSREGLWRAQTPQAFPIALLRAGLARARALGMVPTDDAAMVEALGGRVLLIADRTTNLKITTNGDFVLAEAIAQARR